LLAALLAVLSLTACSGSKLADAYSKDEVIARGEEMVELINTLDYEAVCGELREDLQDQLTPQQLKDAWDSGLMAAGAFEEFSQVVTAGQTDSSTGEDYAVAVLVCKYENSTLTFTISMDTNLDIVGLYMK
jgi:hypothetical protein